MSIKSRKEIVLEYLSEQMTMQRLKESLPDHINRQLISAYLKYFIKKGYATRQLVRKDGCTEIYVYQITELGLKWLFRPKQTIIIDGD